MNNIQKLEEKLLDCWGITDDLDTLFEAIMEENLDRNSIANILLGLKDLYSIKFKKTFNIYEEVTQEYYGNEPNPVSKRVR